MLYWASLLKYNNEKNTEWIVNMREESKQAKREKEIYNGEDGEH